MRRWKDNSAAAWLAAGKAVLACGEKAPLCPTLLGHFPAPVGYDAARYFVELSILFTTAQNRLRGTGSWIKQGKHAQLCRLASLHLFSLAVVRVWAREGWMSTEPVSALLISPGNEQCHAYPQSCDWSVALLPPPPRPSSLAGRRGRGQTLGPARLLRYSTAPSAAYDGTRPRTRAASSCCSISSHIISYTILDCRPLILASHVYILLALA